MGGKKGSLFFNNTLLNVKKTIKLVSVIIHTQFILNQHPSSQRGLPVIGYTEIIVALIAVIGAAATYLLQKHKELSLEIAEKKRTVYASFLKNFTEISIAVMNDEDVSGTEIDKNRMLVRDQLVLYASDDVIKAYDTWIRYADLDPHDIKKESELSNLLLLAIRKDILGKTNVTTENLENLNSFNRG